MWRIIASKAMISFALMELMHLFKVGERNNTTVGIGHHDGFDIAEDEILFEGEKEILKNLSPRKRSEWLASRELLFRIAGLNERVECLYDDFGKPYLKGINKHISVSHSSEWAAAMISDVACGVDIQVYSHTVERIASRFLSNEELEKTTGIGNRWHHLHILWGAKECIYKAYGKKKLEFKQHIAIKSIDIKSGTGLGEIRFENIHLLYEIHFRVLSEAALVFCYLHAGPSTNSR